MNLKLRFALLFALVVAVILFISTTTVYFLSASYRKEDHYKRIADEGKEVYNIVTGLKNSEQGISAALIEQLHDKGLFDEQIFIINSANKIVFFYPDTLRAGPPWNLVQEIRQGEVLRYEENLREYAGIYMPDTRAYVLASGIDWPGFRELDNLKLILAAVFIGALLIAAVLSFVFVRQVFKPLITLNNQIEHTTVQNLTERIPESNANDEINQIARNFNAMLGRLNKAFEFQKNFVHHASHELRTPLAIMLAQTEAGLAKELSGAEYKTILSSLKQDQHRMIELANSLLLISQYEQAGFDPEWPGFRIDETIYEKISNSKRMFPDISVSLSFLNTPVSDSDLLVKGNESLLKSAFVNLIRNAYYYSASRKVDIKIEVLTDTLQLHFENDGPHLLPDEQEKIMMPFFRGHNAQQSDGFGLGLSIVQHVLSMHKGSLIYTPLPNGINRFTVALNKAGKYRA